MSKDIFNCIVKPSKMFYRQDSCIDKIYEIVLFDTNDLRCYEIAPGKLNANKISINNGAINYKNIILMAKINYMEALKYYRLSKKRIYLKSKKESYEFLSRMLLEDVIIKLFSAYDRTYIILNDIYDFKLDSKMQNEQYKKLIREKIEKIDKKVGKRINSIFSRIINSELKKDRDNIIHNNNVTIFNVNENYLNQCVKTVHPPSVEELIKRIEDICKILEDNLNIINNLIREKYN